ncbi:hypothetical protein Pyn_16206 [Prunus yedoensis var. nudiflora]|uniref:Uncharacterized protein n=1 Tax=Prunus yedoensis var. nudiflora TaxID=2094558 RepID=A0A314YGL4_PRUYE|nr:hypothetical protein Pyn_16206 [Prunus yedoensis var. nudiflora]
MMSNPDHHSCNVTYFINNQPHYLMNYSVVLQMMPAASNYNLHAHDIFAFVIPTLLALVQMRYPPEDLFQTHPTSITVFISSFLAYCFAFSFGGHAYKWCHMAMHVFGSLSAAILLWLLFFPLLLLPHFVRIVFAGGRARLGPLGS